MATYYVDSGAGVLELSNRTWSNGELMVPTLGDASTNHLVAKQWVWEVTTGGTSNGTPTWPASVTDDVTTVTQNGVVWTARAPDNWTHAMPGLYWLAANATTKRLVGGDLVYVKSTHAKQYSANPNVIFPTTKANDFVYVVSVNASLASTAGAQESVPENNDFYYGGKVWFWGFTMKCGAGGAQTVSSYMGCGIGGQNNHQVWENCTFAWDNNNAGNSINNVTADYASGHVRWLNCTLSHTDTANYYRLTGTGGGFKAVNLTMTGRLRISLQGITTFIGCTMNDVFTNLGYQGYGCMQRYIGCKITTLTLPATASINPGQETELVAVGTSDHTYQYFKGTFAGEITDNEAIYLTTGGSSHKDTDGALVPYSLKLVATTGNVRKAAPLWSPWVTVFVDQTGSRSVGMRVAYDAATALTDSELILEVEHFTDSASPLLATAHTAPVVGATTGRDVLAAGSALVNTNEAWTGTGGWTNKKTHTLTKVVDVQQQGFLRARIGLAKDVTVYVDNKVLIG